MAKKMLIDATHAEETRVVVVDGNKVEEFDFESAARRQLAGNIYLAKVTRVEPSLQAAFVDYGGNRHGFLAFSEIHPDYYQIPVADREALMAEERAYAEQQAAEAEQDEDEKPKRRTRSRRRPKAAEANSDAVATQEVSGLEVVDLGEGEEGDEAALVDEAPAEPVAEDDAPVADEVAEAPTEEPSDDDDDDDEPQKKEAKDLSKRDETIESVAKEDDSEDVRPMRKPRPKRYKIQEVVKVRQILLVQVVKEERGNKGAALTTYLSLAGRYCVLMPNTARGGGISRKITNAADRKKLKQIANEIEVPQGAGLIIRTAGSQRTRAEIKRDYEYLQRMWEKVRSLTLESSAPARIYEEGDLIKRSIRDLYSKEIDEVIVEGPEGYRTAKDFMKMIMPSHAKNVKPYAESLPLFARFQVEGYLAGMFNPTVQLPSGGYIVIGVTEALVAIDVNSGRATKEGSIEQTALKTNLEASDEVARQLRLRDLAGLIVIDYIDMDERKNNAAVEKRFKDKLKTDRARIQVGRISGFGLLEMSRQRLRPGMLEATTQMCSHCHGTGLLRSDDNVALGILRQLEEEGVRGRTKEVLLKVPHNIMNFLMNHKREHVAQIEMRFGMAVRVEGDGSMISPDFTVEKFKTATREIPDGVVQVVTAEDMMADDGPDEEIVETPDEDEGATPQNAEQSAQDDDQPKKRRRRRRRRRGGGGGDDQSQEGGEANAEAAEGDAAPADTAAPDGDAPADEASEEKPKRRRSRSRKKTEEPVVAAEVEDGEAVAETPDAPVDAEAAEEKPKPKRRSRAKKKVEPVEGEGEAAVAEEAPVAEAEEKPKPKRRTRKKAEPKVEVAAAEVVAAAAVAEVLAPAAPEPEVVEAAAPAPEPKDDKPKRKGWWSLGRS